MNREIKFKAWDKRSKEMLDLTGYKMVGKNNIQLFYYDEDGDRATCTTLLENIELIQYTGIKDKNGTEIYEGYIVKCIEVTNDNILEYVSEVVWDDDCFIVHESEMMDMPLGAFRQKDWQYPLTEIEVIGNIYKNPELLEV